MNYEVLIVHALEKYNIDFTYRKAVLKMLRASRFSVKCYFFLLIVGCIKLTTHKAYKVQCNMKGNTGKMIRFLEK